MDVEVFIAHELFDPFGIRRDGEMEVILLADHKAAMEQAKKHSEETVED